VQLFDADSPKSAQMVFTRFQREDSATGNTVGAIDVLRLAIRLRRFVLRLASAKLTRTESD
jgi:hypothetical protein